MSGVPTRPVFVLGAMRSGTTLVCELLNAHPNFAIFCESFFFRAMYLMHKDFRRRYLHNDVRAARFIEFLFQRYNPYGHGWRPIFQFLDSPQLRSKLMNSDRSSRALVEGVFSAFAARAEAKYWGDKSTPQRAAEITTMHELFPAGRFIHIYRDPRDVVHSLVAARWAKNIGYATQTWKIQISNICQGLAGIPKEQVTHLSYEALCANPELALKSLCEFLREAYHPEMVDIPRNLSPTLENLRVETIKRNAGGAILKGNHAKWKQSLSEKEVRRIERMTGRQMKAYGYDCQRTFGLTLGIPYRLRRLKAIQRRYHELQRYLKTATL